MSNSLFKYIPFNVAQMTSDIEQGRLALPDIQRPFVWPTTKVRDLLDSMYRGFPVGQVMFWRTGAEPGMRQIGTEEKPLSVPDHLIVDGQQRLTSLYAVTRGRTILRADFSRARIRIAFNPFTEQFAVPDATTDRQVEWLADITPLFDDSYETVEGYIERLEQARGEIAKAERKRLSSVFNRVCGLASYPFSVVELDATADEEQVAEIFVRINSEGAVLNQADFILTLMSVFWEKGRRELEDFAHAAKAPSSTGPSPFNWYLQPQPAQMLRVTVAVAFRRAVLKQVYSVLRGKDLDTGKSDATRTREQFAHMQRAQEQVLDLTNWHEFLQVLERAGFRGAKMISSDNTVIYTYALWLIGRTEYGVPLDRLREVMGRWFFMASITSRYTGAFESQFERDLGLLAELSPGDSGGFAQCLDHVVDNTLTGDFWTITMPDSLATSASKSPALLAYVAALNILDAEPLLSTGKVRSRLDPNVLAKKGIERHHLFPKQYLRQQLGITDTKAINQIANMALVEWSDNIKISGRAPAKYWPEQLGDKKRDAGLTDARLERQCHWHALPDGWSEQDYWDFLEQRRTLMAAVVREAFALLRSDGYEPAYPEPTAPAATTPARGWTNYGVSVLDLIEAGLLSAGTALLPSQDNLDAIAEVLPDGRIELDDEVHDSPSGAARSARGGGTNGWTFWIADTRGGPRSLAELRQELLGNEG
ncbi:DUF262 domain-containing protein [Saccharopolyspora cebuensis]|uniref:DUF262 domain-containing protein n=1 Tax=Saccharopolyspora cebuensis TaxID=418759 RepID=A0ABV4CG10_9PSEU